MDEAIRWALAALATYRIAVAISIDDGPGDVFLRFRTWLGADLYGDDGRPYTAWGRWVKCPYCLGLWAAIVCVALVAVAHPLTDALLGVLGLAGAQAVLQGRREPE